MATVRCVWWNVENLFPYDSKQTKDNWRPKREQEYQEKLAGLADVLTQYPGGTAELILICEVATPVRVAGRDAIKDLYAKLGGERDGFIGGKEHAGQTRGITFGIIWDRNRLEMIGEPVPHRVVQPYLGPGADYGRPVVEATFRANGSKREFSVYLNHWSSRMYGQAATEPQRKEASKTLVTLLQDRLCTKVGANADPDALIIAVGDFNDEPFDPSLTDPIGVGTHLFFTRERRSVLERKPWQRLPLLYNPCWRLLGERQPASGPIGELPHLPAGTYLYKKPYPDQWHTIDQVLVSAGLVAGTAPVFQEGCLGLHCPDELRGDTGAPRGPSDHFALQFALSFPD